LPGPFAPSADPFREHAPPSPFGSSHPESATNASARDQATPQDLRRSLRTRSVSQLVELYASMSRRSTRRFYLLAIATVVCFLAAIGLIAVAVNR
jgi:hypothetical protein